MEAPVDQTSNRRRIWMPLAIVLPAAFVFVAVWTLPESGTKIGGIEIADYSAPPTADDRPAPSFTLPTLDGRRTITLEEFSGHPLVVSFWASWCAPCREEAPFLRSAWATYRSDGVRFLGVDHRDGRTAALEFSRRMAYPYPSIFDPGGGLAMTYALIGVPTTFVIGADSRIAYRITGKVDGTNLPSAIDRVLDRGDATSRDAAGQNGR